MNEAADVRAECPLVHCITNYVTVNDVANAILAVGASPIMSDEARDVEDIVSISQALVINIGTLNERTVESMLIAGRKANSLGVPVILDPVGAGASRYRCEVTDRLLREVRFTVIRGNLSEMSYIAGLGGGTKGVDSSLTEKDRDPAAVAAAVSSSFSAVAAITGRVDTVCYGSRVARISSGCAEMGSITGTGCMLSGVIGAFVGASDDAFRAAAAAIAAMGASGEAAFAAAGARGNGSFHMALIDALSHVDDGFIAEHGKLVYAEA